MKGRLTFAISADYERRTGGWIYDQRLLDGLEKLGWTVDRLELPAGFPWPDESARARSARMIEDLPDGTLLLVDQLCLGVMPEVARAQQRRLRLAMIVHHPLGLEGDPASAASQALLASEREALARVDLALATSAATARLLEQHLDMPAHRLAVAPPGIDRLPLAHGSGTPPLRLLTVGAVVPRKDHGRLVGAIAGLSDRAWQLAIVGNLTRAPNHVAGLRRQIHELGLGSRIELRGELDGQAFEDVWREADLYVAASRLEGFGMAVAEAVARGLPVVTTAAGAIGTWIDRRAALVIENDDEAELSRALRRAIDEPELRRSLRHGALVARAALPAWSTTASIVSRALERL
jgi:glycosyltransferase involved in cell wall biosynthesis